MISKYTRFKLNRRFRKIKQQGLKHSDKLEVRAKTQILRRWQRLRPVRGFVFAWFGLSLIMTGGLLFQWQGLDKSYKHEQIIPGGSYTEGMVGSVTNMSPLFALDGPNAAASKLVFNGLMRYDDDGNLINDLARSITTDPTETIYIVKLREDVKWHDGKPFTARDVVFTFRMIQHPDTRSPLNSSWRSIDITAVDDWTVEFKLPNPFSPFPHALTTGIIPEHVLKDLGPGGLRPASFNQAPIGTGPFRFSRLDAKSGEASFVANEDYFFGSSEARPYHFEDLYDL